MPFSHHSHSSSFCAHASSPLESMIQTAISRDMFLYALTEHMPRDQEDFYPEEIPLHPTAASLAAQITAFHASATSLRTKYAPQIALPIGFEAEWIRPSTLPAIQALLTAHKWDFFIGSVHHVHTIPIDFDRATYESARERALLLYQSSPRYDEAATMQPDSDEILFEDYFDAQLAMLVALRPPVVGHFDLIRLYSNARDAALSRWPGVWSRVCRNLGFIAGYGGIVEINSSALRKGLAEPYPTAEVCREFLGLGGRFTLSDDAHDVTQVGTHYAQALAFAKGVGVTALHRLDILAGSDYASSQAPDAAANSTPQPTFTPIRMTSLENHPFFSAEPSPPTA
ncbi:histidinol-phosphatase [Trichodelitschia bisporula]|uniref:Histidinol-phosphatase n=1 Tax=Trichodelitschia bisporula TaxID=703511 RepID=A0A6G1I5C2_9PEZI|nr:histidinol-phosphatase [Trichodelitschia bisporula]